METPESQPVGWTYLTPSSNPLRGPDLLFSIAQSLRECFLGRVGLRDDGRPSARLQSGRAGHVAHELLRSILLSDPVVRTVLPSTDTTFAMGDAGDFPFRVRSRQVVCLAPVLTEAPVALAISARWAIECVRRCANQDVIHIKLAVELLEYLRQLVCVTPLAATRSLLAGLPDPVQKWLQTSTPVTPPQEALVWLAGLIGRVLADDKEPSGTLDRCSELAYPLEAILVSGGDSRLVLDPASGKNRYGVPPRPRPEAIHFSSSTASAVTSHGYLLGELIRQTLLRRTAFDSVAETQFRALACDAIGHSILTYFGLSEGQGDVAIVPSGTDAELLAVLVAASAEPARPLLNILISPEETGRGVQLAGQGRFFDPESFGGQPLDKGARAWEGPAIDIVSVSLRDSNGSPRPLREIDDEFLRVGKAALAQGKRVLAHVLSGSKTGLSAPSLDAAERLRSAAPDRVDIVVDACQARGRPDLMGDLVKRGWMVQTSGSKFLTGPPFSGALVVPSSWRCRAPAVGAVLRDHPAIGHASDWTQAWYGSMPRSDARSAGWGPVFRWLPALLEAQLFHAIDPSTIQALFQRFRVELLTHLDASAYIQPLDLQHTFSDVTESADDMKALSIVTFRVLGRMADGRLSALDEHECRHLFELLNADVSRAMDFKDPAQRSLARLQAHLGQPVTLTFKEGPATALRFVVGARFFNIVCHAEDGVQEAALLSEVADARRAIAKLELLAEHWHSFARFTV